MSLENDEEADDRVDPNVWDSDLDVDDVGYGLDDYLEKENKEDNNETDKDTK